MPSTIQAETAENTDALQVSNGVSDTLDEFMQGASQIYRCTLTHDDGIDSKVIIQTNNISKAWAMLFKARSISKYTELVPMDTVLTVTPEKIYSEIPE